MLHWWCVTQAKGKQAKAHRCFTGGVTHRQGYAGSGTQVLHNWCVMCVMCDMCDRGMVALECSAAEHAALISEALHCS